VTDDSKIATHAEPLGRNRINFIVRLDLADHCMPGHYEQMWTRTEDKRLFAVQALACKNTAQCACTRSLPSW
jgi:hypothetical protein